MYKKSKILALAVILLIPFGFLVSQIPQTEIEEKGSARFIIASTYVFTDEYGQGPYGIDAEENSTGSWLNILPFGGVPEDFNVSVGNFIRLRVDTRLNATLTGATDVTDGKNYLKHNLVVTTTNGTVVFSQENFTYFIETPVGDIYYYAQRVILNFVVVMGEVYTVVITYEIWW